MSALAEQPVPDGGVTDESMPTEWARAYPEACPDRVAEYVVDQEDAA